MGRRHRSSSSVTIGTTTAALSSTNDNNNKAAMPNNEDLTACTFLLRQFVHSTNQNQETGRTPFHRAVGAASVARNGSDDNDNDNVSTTDSDSIRGGDAVGKSSSNVDKERERMDGLFIVDALATRMEEMDALSLGCSSSSPLFKKKKNKMGQSRYNSNISNNSSGSNSNVLQMKSDGFSSKWGLHWCWREYNLTINLIMARRRRSRAMQVVTKRLQLSSHWSFIHNTDDCIRGWRTDEHIFGERERLMCCASSQGSDAPTYSEANRIIIALPNAQSHSKRKSQESSSEDDRPGKRGML